MTKENKDIAWEKAEFERKKQLVQNLNVMDDDFFQKVMEETEVCEEMLQTILQDENLRVVESQPQKFLRNCGSRSVQMDLLCKSSDDRYFNVEVQKSDKDDHQRRVRYNGSNLDTFVTEKGVSFKDVPEVYVIYLAKFDIFHGNCAVYHIDRVVRETGEVVDNGFHEIYTNAGRDDGSRIAKLMQYMVNTRGDCPEFPKLSKRVRYFKEEQEGVKYMNEAVEAYVRERTERMAERITESVTKSVTESVTESITEESAKNLFRNGVSMEVVSASLTRLSPNRVQEIYDEVMSEKK